MKHGDLGHPLDPRRNVTNHKDMGWCGVRDEKGAVVGYAYMYKCTLECGHERTFVTKTCVGRGGDAPAAPYYMHCAMCRKEGRT